MKAEEQIAALQTQLAGLSGSFNQLSSVFEKKEAVDKDYVTHQLREGIVESGKPPEFVQKKPEAKARRLRELEEKRKLEEQKKRTETRVFMVDTEHFCTI